MQLDAIVQWAQGELLVELSLCFLILVLDTGLNPASPFAEQKSQPDENNGLNFDHLMLNFICLCAPPSAGLAIAAAALGLKRIVAHDEVHRPGML